MPFDPVFDERDAAALVRARDDAGRPSRLRRQLVEDLRSAPRRRGHRRRRRPSRTRASDRRAARGRSCLSVASPCCSRLRSTMTVRLSRPQVRGRHDRFPVAAFLQLAVAGQHEGPPGRAIELGRGGHADRDRQAVAERPGVRFDAGDLVAIGVAVQLRQRPHVGVELLRRKEPALGERGVQRRRRVALAQDEAIAVRIARRLGLHAAARGNTAPRGCRRRTGRRPGVPSAPGAPCAGWRAGSASPARPRSTPAALHIYAALVFMRSRGVIYRPLRPDVKRQVSSKEEAPMRVDLETRPWAALTVAAAALVAA